MKSILLALFTVLVLNVSSQLSIVQPSIYYVSKRTLKDSDWIKIGAHVLFAQECTTELPREYPTGIVFLENVSHEEERFSMSIGFKDTVIVAVTYYFSAKQADLLKTIGYSDIKGNASAVKGQWTYILNEPAQRTVIVGDRKQIVVVQTINEKRVG
jgi:hypothetical protein